MCLFSQVMIIHVWRGDLKVPVKVFYLLSLVLCLVFVLCVRLLHLEDPGQETCTDSYLRQAYSERLNTPGRISPGCTEDPAVINTWRSCPTCFRPTVVNISKNFTEVPNKDRLYPRGPQNYFKLRDTVQQTLIRDVVISPTSVCVNTCPYLLGLQLSVSDRLDERNAIRTTWGSVAKTKIWPHASMNADFEILFVLAHKSRTSEASAAQDNSTRAAMNHDETMQLIRAEANRHGDILYLDMMDSYFNLTLKLVSTLHWVRIHCPRTKFFLKVDADTFVNVPLLMDLLIYNEHLLEFSVTGHMYAGDKYVYRDGRWAVNKHIYPIATFPLYASGCAYVISRAAVSKVLDIFPFFPMIDLEDVHITGILGSLVRVHFYSPSLLKMFTEYHSDMWDWCYFMNDTLITGTGVNRGFKKRLIWSGFVLNDWMCLTRNLIKMPCYCQEEFGTGCAYVISASALFTMVRAAPYVPLIPIEDAFVTGILARVGHIQVIDASQGLFTHFKDFYWQRCQMVRHTKLVGTLAGGPRGADIWAAILERNGTCFEEDYSYVFEKYYKLIVVR